MFRTTGAACAVFLSASLLSIACGEDNTDEPLNDVATDAAVEQTEGSEGSEGTEGAEGVEGSGGTEGVGDKGPALPDDPETPGHDSPTATSCIGGQECDYATHTCCVYGPGDAMCIDSTDGCPNGGFLGAMAGTVTICDGPEDCGSGQTCCVAVEITGAKNTCEDAPDCSHLSGGIGVWQICHGDDHCSLGETCAPSDQFDFWGFCG